MIAALIVIFSSGALAQFLLAYCRSILIVYSKVEISEKTREVAGIEGREVSGQEFGRLLGLLRAAPDPGDDRREISVVAFYYHLVGAADRMFAWLAPPVRRWAEQERSGCAYFVAVALDRRVAAISN